MIKYNRKWLGVVLALAIALSALLPSFAVHNPSGHLSSVLGERILICSADGFKWVKLEDLQSGKEKPKPHSDDKCPLCYAARHEAKAVAASWAIPASDYYAPAPVAIRYDSALVSLARTSSLNVRAPPYSFIG
jgi:hypothetical protein